MGFCPQCKGGTLTEVEVGSAVSPVEVVSISAVDRLRARTRTTTGIGEVDRVLGGGLVSGSAVLLGGEPGVGKSTLLLQVAATIALDKRVLMVSAEESLEQVAMRARRVDAVEPGLELCSESDVDAIVVAIGRTNADVVVVDSVQAVTASDVGGPPGGVAQVRESGARFVAAARRHGVPLVMVGHVTKDGQLAGPKVLEHVVDVVLMLEGDHDGGFRLLRATKNRFGSVDRVGVFEMTAAGMIEVADPSSLLVGQWAGNVAGTVLFPAVHGRRAVLLEVQALVVGSRAAQPRRSVKGIDAARVHQLLAVLDRHAGIGFREHDVYVSVVGGMRVSEPAADLPVALALASSRLDVPLGRLAAFGEVGLTGELRTVGRVGMRREEAYRLGVEDLAVPGADAGLVRILAEHGLLGRIPGSAVSAA